MPILVVDRNPHLGRIAIVQTVGTAVVLVAPEILWVVDVRVVVEAIPILRGVGTAPSSAVGLLGLGLATLATHGCQRCTAATGKYDPADHRCSPLGGGRRNHTLGSGSAGAGRQVSAPMIGHRGEGS